MKKTLDDLLDDLSLYYDGQVEDLRNLGHTFKPIGRGVFRQVYRVNNLPIIIKFPAKDNARYGAEHTRNEYRTIWKIENQNRYKKLRRFLPVVHFAGEEGVIVMDEYKVIKNFKRHPDYPKLKKHIKLLSDTYDLDENQFGVDKKGHLIVLDWGFVGHDEEYEWWNTVGYKRDTSSDSDRPQYGYSG